MVAQTIIAVLLGVTQLSAALATGTTDMLTRLTWSWEMLLPGIVSEESLDYFQQVPVPGVGVPRPARRAV